MVDAIADPCSSIAKAADGIHSVPARSRNREPLQRGRQTAHHSSQTAQQGAVMRYAMIKQPDSQTRFSAGRTPLAIATVVLYVRHRCRFRCRHRGARMSDTLKLPVHEANAASAKR